MQPISVTTTDASSVTKYSRPVRLDPWANPVSIIQVDISGSATYTVETSMDDPNDPVSPVAENSMTWFDAADSNIVAKSAAKQGILTASPLFVRLKQTAGSGSATMKVTQFSSVPY